MLRRSIRLLPRDLSISQEAEGFKPKANFATLRQHPNTKHAADVVTFNQIGYWGIRLLTHKINFHTIKNYGAGHWPVFVFRLGEFSN